MGNEVGAKDLLIGNPTATEILQKAHSLKYRLFREKTLRTSNWEACDKCVHCVLGRRMYVYPNVDIIHLCIHLLIQQSWEGFRHAQARSGPELGLPWEGCNEGLEHGEAMERRGRVVN